MLDGLVGAAALLVHRAVEVAIVELLLRLLAMDRVGVGIVCRLLEPMIAIFS